ncbi:hypothetical protein [Deinococcus koreensis]|uniref:Uncharacterized protein n=1 Tax=Deinococcus koreensis TaxID=2054903 RepID=A0A2K3V109_9DEIO|nr:hypothetical protein [Deinococcus koreensis]PNY82470.1 hypothetical protein CVO96_14930 [Deinococcus koreensis]
MTPDDWRLAMEHEAAHSTDGPWALEARWTARRLRPWPLRAELTIPAVALMMNGIVLTTLMAACIRSQVLREYDPLGFWVLERTSYGSLIEIHYYVVPLILAVVMGLGGVRPGVLALMGAASIMLCSAGAWMYTLFNAPMTFSTVGGEESVNLMGYAALGGWFRMLLTAVLMWMGAAASSRLQAFLFRRST